MKLEKVTVNCPRCDGTGTAEVIRIGALTAARHRAGLTVEALAKRTGLSVSLLYKVENGVRTCTKRVEKAYSGL